MTWIALGQIVRVVITWWQVIGMIWWEPMLDNGGGASISSYRITVLERDLLCRAKATLLNLLGREEVTDFLICCRWRTGLVGAKELPRGFVSEVQLAGHDCMVCERGAFPQALLIELGAGALEADFPGGSRVAAERHRLAIHHAVLLWARS